jgi:hypothetical protein
LLHELADGELRRHAKAGPRVSALTVLPGVGQFTALVIVAEVGDITRFGSARKLASWRGWPRRSAGSDLSVRHGHISKQGSAWLRWVLNQAALTAKRSPEFSATYAAPSKRRGKKIAAFAIARKLLTRAYHLLAAAQADQVTSTPGTAGHAPADQKKVAKPRARSLQRHEPAQKAALDHMNEQPGPRTHGHGLLALVSMSQVCPSVGETAGGPLELSGRLAIAGLMGWWRAACRPGRFVARPSRCRW